MKSIVLGVAIYFVIWWMVLFAVLPWGVKSQEETGEITEGSDPGAPAHPLLPQKAIATTVISALLMFAGYAIWAAGLINDILLPIALIPPAN